MSTLGLLGFVAVLLVVTVTGGADVPDQRLERFVLTLRRPALDHALAAVTVLGSFPIVLALTALAAAVLWWRTRTMLLPTALIGAVGLTAGTVYLVKVAVARSRPPFELLLGRPSTDYAFPSGHTTDGTVGWVLSTLLIGWTVASPALRRSLFGLAVTVAVTIGCSRVYLGYHWPSDVLAGWLLALTVVSGLGYALAWVGPFPTGTDNSKRHQPSAASVASTSPR